MWATQLALLAREVGQAQTVGKAVGERRRRRDSLEGMPSRELEASTLVQHSCRAQSAWIDFPIAARSADFRTGGYTQVTCVDLSFCCACS